MHWYVTLRKEMKLNERNVNEKISGTLNVFSTLITNLTNKMRNW